MKRILTALLTGLLASNVWAETYSYTGATYTNLNNRTTSALGSVGDFLNSMKITGSLTTAAPLAANLADVNVTAQVTAYSFSDGLTTYASSDANVRQLQHFTVSTNASGQITAMDVVISRWQAGPHNLSGRVDYFLLNGAAAIGVHNTKCTGIGISMVAAVDSCVTPNMDSNSSEGSAIGGGAWSGPLAGSGGVVTVPTLSEWALLALVSLMAMFGIASTRRQRW